MLTLNGSILDNCQTHPMHATYGRRGFQIRLGIMSFARVMLLFATISQAGCVAAFDGYLIRREAELQFSVSNSCPRNRLAVDRIAIKPRALLATSLPPPEVTADPERLKLWNRNADDSPDRLMTMSAVDVRGCDIEISYLCWQEWSSGEDDAQHLVQQCHDVDAKGSSTKTIGGLRLKPDALESLQTRLRSAGHPAVHSTRSMVH